MTSKDCVFRARKRHTSGPLDLRRLHRGKHRETEHKGETFSKTRAQLHERLSQSQIIGDAILGSVVVSLRGRPISEPVDVIRPVRLVAHTLLVDRLNAITNLCA